MSKSFPLLVALVALLAALVAPTVLAHAAHAPADAIASYGDASRVEPASAFRQPGASRTGQALETLTNASVDVYAAPEFLHATFASADSGCPSHDGGACCCGSDRISTPPHPAVGLLPGERRRFRPQPERVLPRTHLIPAHNAGANGPLGSRAPPIHVKSSLTA